MSDETTPSRPSLATFLHGKPAPKPEDAVAVDANEAATPPAAELLPASEPEAPVSEPLEIAHPVARDAASEQVVDPVDTADDAESEAASGPAPSFSRSARASRAAAHVTPRWQWALVAGLALLLGVQILIADRARLAADAGTRPLVSALCTVLRCSLPAWHEPSAYTMLSRDIRPAPGQPGVLQVHASFRNDARWAQAWPALRLSLSDADGRVIGRRTFQPAEYLGPTADPQARLEQGQSAQVSFQLHEPAAATVAFSFEFH
ncbi:hypothetical protein ABB26_00065 [Stenotrophomonas humi]|uniref:DUF3426 domain-containing protein n=1 Tax=Stenotrophomonas humi TaxID=405444 RepID=A0A0R0CA94_9GAMM|nr:DUF3426 domain-containing protein [Stenotrophomonas humi]KRG66492.1 hypothetical protein ABB26_00065 [Stenotrophomonas humi]